MPRPKVRRSRRYRARHITDGTVLAFFARSRRRHVRKAALQRGFLEAR